MSLLSKLNETSPKRCRLLARKAHGQRMKTNADIARDGGLARSTVAKISKLDRWDSLSLEIIDAYARGCGVDLLRPNSRRDKRFLKGRLLMLDRGSASQRRMYGRLLKESFSGGRRQNGEPCFESNRSRNTVNMDRSVQAGRPG